MRRVLRTAAAVLLLAVLSTGCAVNRTSAMVEPGVKLSDLKTLHVKKFEKDERQVDALIADKLRASGFTVTSGEPAPSKVDGIVTYVDKWFWDITMYMLELTINIRDPKTDYPLASGNSYHTSLTRLSPPAMVNEVVDNILKEGKAKQ